jgi:hypothetical protein
VKPLTENWSNFMNMFALRHKIIHEMNDRTISVGRIAGMCDSTMNFIDAADFIFMIKLRDVIKRLQSNITLRERNYRIDKAMEIAIQRGNVPPDIAKKYHEFISR